MVRHFMVGIFIVIVAAIALANHHNFDQSVFDLDRGQKTALSDLIPILKKNPETGVVVLTGVGHAQKVAIPRQIDARSTLPYAVILPEVPGKIDAQTVSKKEADYILLGL